MKKEPMTETQKVTFAFGVLGELSLKAAALRQAVKHGAEKEHIETVLGLIETVAKAGADVVMPDELRARQ